MQTPAFGRGVVFAWKLRCPRENAIRRDLRSYLLQMAITKSPATFMPKVSHMGGLRTRWRVLSAHWSWLKLVISPLSSIAFQIHRIFLIEQAVLKHSCSMATVVGKMQWKRSFAHALWNAFTLIKSCNNKLLSLGRSWTLETRFQDYFGGILRCLKKY